MWDMFNIDLLFLFKLQSSTLVLLGFIFQKTGQCVLYCIEKSPLKFLC